jgi:hypothetical protein
VIFLWSASHAQDFASTVLAAQVVVLLNIGRISVSWSVVSPMSISHVVLIALFHVSAVVFNLILKANSRSMAMWS